jgi:hypothetical protein
MISQNELNGMWTISGKKTINLGEESCGKVLGIRKFGNELRLIRSTRGFQRAD